MTENLTTKNTKSTKREEVEKLRCPGVNGIGDEVGVGVFEQLQQLSFVVFVPFVVNSFATSRLGVRSRRRRFVKRCLTPYAHSGEIIDLNYEDYH